MAKAADIIYVDKTARPAAPPPPAAKPSPTVEDVKEAVKDATSVLFGRPIATETQPTPEPTPEPAPPTEPPTPEREPHPKAVAAPEPEPELAPASAPAPVVALTKLDIKEAVRDGMREAAPAPVPAAPALELGEEDENDLRGIRHLEATGKLPKGKADEHLAFIKKNYAYQDEWTTANPDKEFNPDDDEHSAWYEKNTPKGLPEKKAIERAAIQAIADEAAESKWKKEYQPLIDEQNAEKAWKAAAPEVSQRFDNRLVELAEKVNPEFGKLLRKDGKVNLGPEALKALEEADPFANDEINRVLGDGVADTLIELEKLAIPECRKLFNPEKNAIHRRIARMIANAEAEMAAAPKDIQVSAGKQWISSAEYQRRMDAGESRAELERTTWVITVDDLADIEIDAAAKRIKPIVERQNKLADKKHGKNGNGTPAQPHGAGNPEPEPEPAPEPQNPPPAPSPRRGPPSVSSTSDAMPVTTGVPAAVKTQVDQITSVLFRK